MSIHSRIAIIICVVFKLKTTSGFTFLFGSSLRCGYNSDAFIQCKAFARIRRRSCSHAYNGKTYDEYNLEEFRWTVSETRRKITWTPFMPRLYCDDAWKSGTTACSKWFTTSKVILCTLCHTVRCWLPSRVVRCQQRSRHYAACDECRGRRTMLLPRLRFKPARPS